VSGLNRLLGSGANRASLADAAQWPNGSEASSQYVTTDSHRCMLLVAELEAQASKDDALDGSATDAY